MKYILSELDKMNREQLESIANELTIKGIKKFNNEGLAYQILDAQARQESVKPTPEPAKPKARRGRPPKKAEPETKQEEPASQAAPQQEKPAAKQNAKKPKAPKAEPAPAERPAAETAPQQEASATRKRGRKPKNTVEVPNAEEPKAEDTKVEGQKTAALKEEQPAQPAQPEQPAPLQKRKRDACPAVRRIRSSVRRLRRAACRHEAGKRPDHSGVMQE